MNHDPRFSTTIVGPGFDAPTTQHPNARTTPPRMQTEPFDPANEAGEYTPIDPRLLRRLMVALVLIILSAALCWIVLPRIGVALPPIVPLVAFAAIATGSILAGAPARESARESSNYAATQDSACGCDEGTPFGCCSGPRPLRIFRDKP